MHAPLTHCAAPHWIPHPPQLVRSVEVTTHAPEQSVSVGKQLPPPPGFPVLVQPLERMTPQAAPKIVKPLNRDFFMDDITHPTGTTSRRKLSSAKTVVL